MAKEELFATKALGAARERKGLTQQEMADLLTIKLDKPITMAQYQKWEQGRRSINTDAALAISRELRQSIKDLFVKGEYSFER